MTPEETSQTSHRQPQSFVRRLLTAKAYFVFLHIIVVVLAIQVYLLTRQAAQQRNPQVVIPLKIGDSFSRQGLVPLDGRNLNDTAEALVFVFTATCRYCDRNMDLWNDLASHAASAGVQVFGVSLDNSDTARVFLSRFGATYPVFTPKELEEYRVANKITGVPKTIFLRPNGIVEYLWEGLLSEDHVTDILSVINEKVHR